MTSEMLEPRKLNKEEGSGQEFESGIDRMLFEVYGRQAVEDFEELWKRNPDLSLEKAFAKYEKSPTNQQTNFFRTHNLEVVANELVPKLEKSNGEPVEILDVGCSSGDEVYSLGIHLLDAGYSNFQIRGIDVSPERLQDARSGKYKLWVSSPDQIGRLDYSHLKQEHLEKGYFHDSGERWKKRERSGRYSTREMIEMKKRGQKIPEDAWKEIDQVVIEVGKQLQSRTTFDRHDIIDGPYPAQHDIVVINHVLLHYPEKTREKIMKNVLASMKPGGFLVLEHAMHPIRPEENDWLLPYNEWRKHLTERFPLEEIETEDPILKEHWKAGQYYRLIENKQTQ